MRADHPILAHRERLRAQGTSAPWVALFDIDSTLMDTSPRNAAILAEAFEVLPALKPWRGRVRAESLGWNVLAPLQAAGVDTKVQTEVMAFWKQRFFTDEWLAHDTPYPGAAEFLHELKADGFQLAYLTGRHTAGMEKGTRQSFRVHGLPADEPFFFKPTFEMGDREYKASVCDAVARLGTLVVSVDNEPANVNLFRAAFPLALVVWLDTLTSPDPEPLAPGIVTADPAFFLDR